MYMCIYIIFMSETNLELLFFLSLTHTHIYIYMNVCMYRPVPPRTSYYVVPICS